MRHEVIYKYDEQMETRKWANQIPFIKFPEQWEIKISPPFAGATIRFSVKSGEANVSVYLDCFDNLGGVGEPYWEIYPHDDDVYRCRMDDTEDLLKEIQTSIDQQNLSK